MRNKPTFDRNYQEPRKPTKKHPSTMREYLGTNYKNDSRYTLEERG